MGVPVDEGERWVWYASMRRAGPAHYDRERGSWSVFRYRDAYRVLSDHNTFSSSMRLDALSLGLPTITQAIGLRDGGEAASTQLGTSSLLSLDPPSHTRMRKLVASSFTPRAMSHLEAHIAATAQQLLDRAAPRGRMDVVADLAQPLSMAVCGEILGIPPADWDLAQAWVDARVGTREKDPVNPDIKARVEADLALMDYFRELIAERRRRPSAGLVSRLANAEVEPKCVPAEEVIGLCSLLLTSGFETMRNLIGNCVLSLLENPKELVRLKVKPELLSVAVEETLRYRSPVQAASPRVAKRDVHFGWETLRQGQTVVAWIGSANRDEAVFAAADRFRLTRRSIRHLAFGSGIHYCLGAALARLTTRLAVKLLLERLEHLRLDPDRPHTVQPRLEGLGCECLPVLVGRPAMVRRRKAETDGPDHGRH